MLQWITKKACKHMHHDNQNEMLELMAHQVLRRILDDTHTSPFLAVMVDETRDQSNKEQLTLVLRWVSDDVTVSEEFVGLYYLSVIDAQSIVDAINDAFLRFQIPFTKLRGQCYDGCSTMAGARTGVAVKIQELEPRAVFTHHALNLAETYSFWGGAPDPDGGAYSAPPIPPSWAGLGHYCTTGPLFIPRRRP